MLLEASNLYQNNVLPSAQFSHMTDDSEFTETEMFPGYYLGHMKMTTSIENLIFTTMNMRLRQTV